jgi:hypothetical protein
MPTAQTGHTRHEIEPARPSLLVFAAVKWSSRPVKGGVD